MHQRSCQLTHVYKLVGELESRGLEAQVTGRAGQNEAKVYVDDVAFSVQQDVAIVSGEMTGQREITGRSELREQKWSERKRENKRVNRM